MVFLPDESRSLPPPPLLNKGSVWLGFAGWMSALLNNAFNQRPVLRAGVHRQILFATLGWFVGYQLVKRAEYMHAKVDRELFEYIRHHPVDFHAAAEKKRIGQLLEDFRPIR
ncbi:NADH dehydrogenase [ubiquinone] 1 subunit C2 [Corvus hawaiiensis]|uniref:NADH dehydrogenase [ubiquinone] 1 subunit C2 n=2 Tax=Corvus TaxID=30420 RepID=A0A8C3E601_CORMO|nr:NADH dehydrogenase [ubiquinone] 1 subunit C2 [Corvus moneduloides]XP_041880111.1 NADH dehydrogenase [ubiquinone] 1 subunit C2-like [Corvus kubaryi]XP_048151674.1 NADH dehydrogenase [ubiquinone] 1 subunit C2 [Corvus hawaiiensis]